GAGAGQARPGPVEAAHDGQVAEIGQYPVGTRLHELVVIELRQVLLEHDRLLGNDLEQGAERPALLRVAEAEDRRQQLKEAVGVEAHRSTPPWSRLAAARAPH